MAGKFVKKTVPVTTNNITTGIVNQILSDGWSASRINTAGIWDENAQRFRTSGGRKGTADVLCCIKGRFVAIEVKNKHTRDKASAEQLEFKAEVENAGGIYFFAESIEAFNHWYFYILPTIL